MANGLPQTFPCWCRAIYSWGGETDKDLGFIEGDLIECLNAGDGQWWMGRLRRDRRMVGVFPSNFVSVLENNFVPVSRSVSPMPGLQQNGGGSQTSITKAEREKQKAKARRPFHGYKTAPTPGTPAATPPHSSPAAKPKEPLYDPANPPSTVLWQMGASPRRGARSPSPMPHHEIGCSPPPPPPPHRVGVGGDSVSRRTPSPQPYIQHDHYDLHTRTPSPALASLQGHTPPMIRDAADDLLSTLEDMDISRRVSEPQEETDAPFNPWSPDEFEIVARSSQRPNTRPLTSLGLGAGGSSYPERPNYSSRHNSPDRYTDGPPQLSTYVQRMESRLRQMQDGNQVANADDIGSDPPEVPPKNSPWNSRALSALAGRRPSIRNRKSAHELGRTFTTKTSSTNSSSGVHSNVTGTSHQTSMTSQSVMSGHSAGAFSATSAGSLARRNKFGSIRDRVNSRPMTSSGTREHQHMQDMRPQTPMTGVSFPSSHPSRQGAQSAVGWESHDRPGSGGGMGGMGGMGGLGGFSTPKAKRTGFFKKAFDSAKTIAASARSINGTSHNGSSPSPSKSVFGNAITGIAGGSASSPTKSTRTDPFGRDAAQDMGLSNDWVSMRRDVNRSNTPGPTERQERANRCQMLDYPVICPVDELYESAEGNEGTDGLPVPDPFQLNNPSFSQLDKAARCITSLPPTITPASLATGYVCRPYRSDVQRLRAMFTWCAERIGCDEDFDGEIDSRRVIQTKRGSSQEVAFLVAEMCRAINIHAEVVRGYLKTPGEDLDLDAVSRPNHHWNAILVENEWRIMDCSLASSTNPRRALYSSVSPQIAEPFYFLAKPLEACYTHIPFEPEQQHIVPPMSPDVLLALPTACPPYFRQSLQMHNYDTSLIRLDALEPCSIAINVPPDVELVAEVETKSFLHDQDGDAYENPDAVTKKRSLAQAIWYTPPNNCLILQKRYVIKAFLPGDEGSGVLKIYAGKKGLMHSSKEIVHPLALALPLYHQGDNPLFDFVKRYPTVHATRTDLYLIQPQCYRLCSGETYLFTVRQHAASVLATPTVEQGGFDLANRPVSPNPSIRPASAMSMTSSSAAGSNPSEVVVSARPKDKPSKLAVQSPGGKIIRLSRKHESEMVGRKGDVAVDGEVQGSVWECVVKVGERGIWRGLVLADRSARWCVWGEWVCG